MDELISDKKMLQSKMGSDKTRNKNRNSNDT